MCIRDRLNHALPQCSLALCLLQGSRGLMPGLMLWDIWIYLPLRKAMKAEKAMTAMKAKAMTAMKAMQAMKSLPAKPLMTMKPLYNKLAEMTGLKTKDVKATINAIRALATDQLDRTGSFQLGYMLKMKRQARRPTHARSRVHPRTREPCVFKYKPASYVVKVYAMKKFKDAINL